MATVHILRATLLRAAGVEKRRRLAVGKRLFHFGPGHHFELDQRFPALDHGGHGQRRVGWCLSEQHRGKQQRDGDHEKALHWGSPERNGRRQCGDATTSLQPAGRRPLIANAIACPTPRGRSPRANRRTAPCRSTESRLAIHPWDRDSDRTGSLHQRAGRPYSPSTGRQESETGSERLVVRTDRSRRSVATESSSSSTPQRVPANRQPLPPRDPLTRRPTPTPPP